MTRRIFIVGLLLITSFAGCKETVINPVNNTIDYKSYYPLVIGHVLEYDVLQITIDRPSGYFDTVKYKLKEVFEETFIDNLGDTAYKIERFIFNDANATWNALDVWYANPYENELHVMEENIRYIKLKNPLSVGNEWNGNKYNLTDSLNLFSYRVLSFASEEINTIIYDSILTIEQRYDSSLIDKILYQEKYARNIGLVFKEQTIINSQFNLDPNIPIEDRISTGSIFKMSLTSHIYE